MNVSKQFLKDFAYLANRYRWTPDEIEEIKAHVRAHQAEMVRYWTNLAIAHRAGYEQTPENGHIRLEAWCVLRGWTNPSQSDFGNVERAQALAEA